MSKHTIALLAGCLAVASIPLHAQTAAPASAPSPSASQGTGTITGRVQNIATGQYLNKARVTLKGTTQTVLTDNFGVYRLVNVPAGEATVEVFYTDLDVNTAVVTVPASGTVERSFDLTSVARYGSSDPSTVKLDAFKVASDRETDAQAIATNEQRFAPNIKNVMSTDSLGDVLGGSVGEFIKFLPGVTVENDLADVSGISVRGIGGAMTSITNDGAPASNIWVSSTRTVDIRSMALNDIARIELTKVPTPSSPADALAGSVNMVSKSAFERSGRIFRYSLNLVGNSENLTLKKTPHSHKDENTYKILPGANIDFTWPITKTFGIVVAATNAHVFNEQHRTLQTWSATGTGITPTPSNANPYLSSFSLLDGPRDLTRNTASIKADWKATPHSVLSAGHVASRTDTRIGSLSYVFNTGTTGTSTIAGGTPLSYGSDYTIGATGRGSVNNNGTNQLINQITDTSTLSYRYDDGAWRIESGLSRSFSETVRRYSTAGFFLQALATNREPVRVSFRNISGARPGAIDIFTNTNTVFNYSDINNYRGTTANNADLDYKSKTNNGYVNVRRSLPFLPVPTSLQVGYSQREQMLDSEAYTEAWTFMGPGGTDSLASVAPYTMQVYKNVDPGYGFNSIPWMSPRRAWDAFLADPKLYQKSAAQIVTENQTRIENSERIDETVQAAYIQADTSLFKNRFRILGGVRFEHTEDLGQGVKNDSDAVWQRDSAGNYIRNAAGARIRKPEAGAAGSLQELLLTRTRRGAHSKKIYQGYYPSLHLTFNATENFIVRAAYAKTYGRPNFSDIIPRVVSAPADLDDDDPTPTNGNRGTLTIRNPNLKPWTADNFDLSAEYYTNNGGLFTVGVFRKNLQNFFGDASRFATPAVLAELELPNNYLGWNIVTKFNSGDASITGGELNVKQQLTMLGKWGRAITLFANGTKLQLDGNPGASFTSFIPRSGNWGATVTYKRLSVTARWNYRGLDKRAPMAAYGVNGYEYIQARTVLDFTTSYQLTKRLSMVGSVNNVFNKPQRFLRYGDDTPKYAYQYAEQEYGISMAIGLRGSF